MTTKRRLTPQEWATGRRRWEGDIREGFDWLAMELRASLDVEITRQAVGDMARRRGWAKAGPPSAPLAPAALAVLAAVAQVPANLAQDAGRHEVADEVVDDTGAQGKPLGYLGTGRPAKYRPEFDAKIIEFFDKAPFVEVDVPQPSGAVRRQRLATDPPMLSDFAKSIGVSRDSVNRWATDVDGQGGPRYPRFADAYARAREMNESMLARAALLGLYDNRISQFVLKNLYGWQDQPARVQEVVPVSAAELQATFVDRMNAAYARQAEVLAERAHLFADEPA